jgi:hypothetical protein
MHPVHQKVCTLKLSKSLQPWCPVNSQYSHELLAADGSVAHLLCCVLRHLSTDWVRAQGEAVHAVWIVRAALGVHGAG